MRDDARLKITSRVPTYIQCLENIVLISKSDKTRSGTFMYPIDHVIGKSTTKIENMVDNNSSKENKSDKELSWNNLKEDNLLKLK
ncbi:Uncharacterised protein [uncultured Clostridium sp.]|nr:Uncharacterised protein [uncultured Clostridium sp.]